MQPAVSAKKKRAVKGKIRMRRYEAVREIMKCVDHELVVCNLGNPSEELFALQDRPENFYMLGSMGLASSIGLGIAMATPKKVLVLEGDGALLMNLGTLATIGANKPPNYILAVIDNGAYGSTGFQDTFTSGETDLQKVALSCGIRHSILITAESDIAGTIGEALKANDGPYCIVIKTDKGMPDDIPIVPIAAGEIKKRFMECIAS